MVRLMKHNEIQYSNILAAIEGGKYDILVTQDTGTGKGYVGMALCQTFRDKKILYVAPKHAIIKQFVAYGDGTEPISTSTYNKAVSEDAVKMMADAYDLFLVDEAHHLGSDIYGRNLLALKDLAVQAKKPYVAFTATPVRDSDGVDISDNFSTVLDGYTLFDCIQDGLVKPFDYIVCSSDMVEQLNALPGDGTLVDGKKLTIDFESSEDLLRDIVAHNPRNKWLVFFSTIKDLEDHMPLVKSLFPDYPIKVIHSDSDDTFDYDELNSMDKWVVASVDMLVEGVHLDGSEGGISFRNVHSFRVFRQMMGRLTSIGSNNYPLMIDCTESAYRMLAKLEEEQRARQNGAGKSQGKFTDLFNVTLDNRRYFDLMRLYEKTEVFTFHDKEYRHFAEVADEYGWNYADFLSWKNRQDWKSMTKTQICEGYEEFFRTWVIHFNGKEYRSYEDVCTDMSWSTARFESWRRKSKMAVGKTRTEIVEEYYKMPWAWMFYFHTNPYPLYGGYESVIRDMGWNREDFYAFLGTQLTTVATGENNNQTLFHMYENHLLSTITIDGHIFATDKTPPYKAAKAKALDYIGATEQQFIDFRRTVLGKDCGITESEQLQVFARYFIRKEDRFSEYGRCIEKISSMNTENVKIRVTDPRGKELPNLSIPADMKDIVLSNSVYTKEISEEEDNEEIVEKDPAEPDRVIFFTAECLAPDGQLEKYIKGESEDPLDKACVTRLSNLSATADATLVLCGEYRKLFDRRESGELAPVSTTGQAVLDQLNAAGISLSQMTPDVKTLRYMQRTSQSPKAAEIKDWLNKHPTKNGVNRHYIIFDTVRHTDYVTEMHRIAVNQNEGISAKNLNDAREKLHISDGKKKILGQYDAVVFTDLVGTLAPAGWAMGSDSRPAMDEKVSMLREIAGSTNACVVLIGDVRKEFDKNGKPVTDRGKGLAAQMYGAGIDVVGVTPDFFDGEYQMNPHAKGRETREARWWCTHHGSYTENYLILRGDLKSAKGVEARNVVLDPKVGLSEKTVGWCVSKLSK